MPGTVILGKRSLQEGDGDFAEMDLVYDYYEVDEEGHIVKWPDTDNDSYQRTYFIASEKDLEKEELEEMTPEDLRLMRNEIFAAYGYIFNSADLKEHFSSKKWYVPRYDNVDDKLTSREKENIKLIREVETSR